MSVSPRSVSSSLHGHDHRNPSEADEERDNLGDAVDVGMRTSSQRTLIHYSRNSGPCKTSYNLCGHKFFSLPERTK